jgi:hypothetical protein
MSLSTKIFSCGANGSKAPPHPSPSISADLTPGLVLAISLVISVNFLALVWHLKHWLSSDAWPIKGLPGTKTRQKAMAKPINLRHFIAAVPYFIFLIESPIKAKKIKAVY